MHEYDLIADWYARNRGTSAGVEQVRALCEALPSGAHVLDVGCGTGLPLTAVLLDHGCRVTALDSSAPMLKHFVANHPEVPTMHARIERDPLPATTYDAVLAWGVLFHLDHAAQEAALGNIAQALVAGGRLLFTAGDEHGSMQGSPMAGVPFRYWSFSPDGYREQLAVRGLTLDDIHVDEGNNTYYRAHKGG